VGDSAPETDLLLVPVPISDPLAEAAELGTPPALAELREYIEEIDIRFESYSDMETLDRTADSGKGVCFVSSAMVVPGESFGVSKSSTATSSLLVVLLKPSPCFKISETLVFLEL